ncbi:helix-turn-helix domain-containing protein [Lutimaribacter marinistellae]|uniref:Helix-turn-helix domain-containing protein n=1 Tax=Lutimaribacter marinistellae TaxID=1820329 RepID=A0ABV7TKW9_9RHOB
MFGENLRRLSRRYRSISELSRQLGVNRTQYNRYLSGESFPRPDVLDKICRFFDVDARILLDPVDEIGNDDDLLTGPVLQEFFGPALRELDEKTFPSGLFRFSRKSFLRSDQYVIGIVRVFRKDGATFIRGFEVKDAMRQQGLPTSAKTREFRGFVTRQDDGVAFVVSRRNGLTCSFNYLSRVTSFDNNFWVGYVSRTTREHAMGGRATRMVYEFLGNDMARILDAARTTGFSDEAGLLPFHRRLLKPEEPFR